MTGVNLLRGVDPRMPESLTRHLDWNLAILKRKSRDRVANVVETDVSDSGSIKKGLVLLS
jgi:hypothetical protein